MTELNRYIVTDINNTVYTIEADEMGVETTNNCETYISFYVENKFVAIINLSNVIAIVQEN